MNKNTRRLVFNKSRGRMMAVLETASSPSKFGGAGTAGGGWATNFFTFTPRIPRNGSTPVFPVAPRIWAPYASPIGNSVSNTIGGILSFIELDPNVNGVKK